MGQAVVPFMARVVEHAAISRSRLEIECGGPRRSPRRRIDEGDLVWIASRPVRVNRSISRRPGDAPRVAARKLVDSMTSVVPSHRPCAAPMYMRIADGRIERVAGAASIGSRAYRESARRRWRQAPGSGRCGSWRYRRQGTSRRESRRRARCSGRRGRSLRTSHTARRVEAAAPLGNRSGLRGSWRQATIRRVDDERRAA